MPTGFTKEVSADELATVNAKFGPATADRTGGKVSFPFPTEGDGFVFGAAQDVTLPGIRVEHLTTDGVRWQSMLDQNHGQDIEAEFTSPFEAFDAGTTYTRTLNYAVFGPTMPNLGFEGGSVYRVGNELVVSPALYGDLAGDAGYSVLSSAKFELYRDGDLIESSDKSGGSAVVPADDAEYRAVVTTTRPRDVFDLSTEVTASWTFRSAFVDENSVVPQQVSAIRYTPPLDENNTGPAGEPFLVPVWLQHNGTGMADQPHTLSVQVSYDEGKTWQEADVVLNMIAQLNHPADAESVSLRATATDRDGNSVTETVIRAYTLRK
jgi:hypothetical protein